MLSFRSPSARSDTSTPERVSSLTQYHPIRRTPLTWLRIALVALLFASGVVITGVGTASAATATFALSRTSGRPGLSVYASQVTPCPANIVGQSVRFDFRDTGGTTSMASLMVPVDQVTGTWKYGAKLGIQINATLGKGLMLAACLKPSGETTLTYASVPYTVVGAVATFAVAQPSYTQGQTLRATSSTPCPASSYVRGYVMSTEKPLPAYDDEVEVTDVDPTSGKWTLDWELVKQAYIHGSLQNAPTGQYQLRLWCVGLKDNLLYPTVYFDVKSFSHDVAMGDSYSSGEGLFEYDIASEGCHRSPKAYAYYVAKRQKLGVPVFVACSGAQTRDFYDANPNHIGEAPQLSSLTKETKIVTLTIGGNDAGFGRVLTECANHPKNAGFGCSTRSSLVNATNSHLAALAGTKSGVAEDSRKIVPLKTVYKSIRKAAPNAKIFVAGYPRLFGSKKSLYKKASGAPSKSLCVMTVPVTIDYADAQWINGRADALNKVISTAVKASGDNIFYVPPALFGGHGQCDSQEEWINTIVLDSAFKPQPESMHPNAPGQSIGYGSAFTSVMNQH